jgi:hypothetical protein
MTSSGPPAALGHGPSMLLAFRWENFRSFRDAQELSLVATSMARQDIVRHVRWREDGKTVGVLPAACVFGANAAGKSNVLKAMDDMRSVVLGSFSRWSPSGGTFRRPFVLDESSRLSTTKYEVDLIIDGVRVEYGFRLDDERIVEEWAYRYPRGRTALLFHREGSVVRFGTAMPLRSAQVQEVLRDNALFLSTAAALRQEVLMPLYEWFRRNLLLAEASTRSLWHAITQKMLTEVPKRQKILALLQAADLGITDIAQQAADPAMLEKAEAIARIIADGLDVELASAEIADASNLLLHHQSASGHAVLSGDEESLGTMVWLGLIGPLVDCLENGSVLLADELDASLHPALVNRVIALFQNPLTNPRRAQVIFNSHDTTILGNSSSDRLLGRDQIWFATKKFDGSTSIYPLSDMDPRKEEAIGRRYLAGRYGATPIVSESDFIDAALTITEDM